ncbi:MAG TPA: holo-ACP synthase [Pseudogracilibacillus sp.]|nr:holo-ACP synthase [Pseudogracilibacillus sp.]
MIKGIGIDIVELDRIERLMSKGDRFTERILTTREREALEKLSSLHRKVEFVAGRFAAKEAFAKATGHGIGKLSFQHIEVLSNDLGAPELHVQSYKQEKLFVSISHSKQYAVAQVIITQ